MTVKQARPFVDDLPLSAAEMVIADKVLEEIQQRLRFLDETGLDYLTLDRLTSTLSGGEAQRIQLATSLGSHLVGAFYVLDEPSIGLHPRDTNRLFEILKGLRDLESHLYATPWKGEHQRILRAPAQQVGRQPASRTPASASPRPSWSLRRAIRSIRCSI